MIYGYARVDNNGASLASQKASLERAGCEDIVLVGRRQAAVRALENLIDRIGSGDTLVVTALDRLPQDLDYIILSITRLRRFGANFRVLSPALDTRDRRDIRIIWGLQMAAAFTASRAKDRRRLPTQSANSGVSEKRGRPRSIKTDEIRAALAKGERATEVAARLGIGRATVYRIKKEAGGSNVQKPSN